MSGDIVSMGSSKRTSMLISGAAARTAGMAKQSRSPDRGLLQELASIELFHRELWSSEVAAN
jgi:hypothetical protein